MNLPRRTRSHILEDLSVRKFQSLLPEQWIYRTPTHDYGIDGEVEIIDSKGYTTGKKFLVQLKATDEENETKALKLRMKISSLNYFNQLGVPILIVRYLAKSGSIYTRWLHSLNPNDDTKAEKSFCMLFQEKDKWTDVSAEKRLNELEAYHSIKRHLLQKPFLIAVRIDSKASLSQYTAKFATKIIGSSKQSRCPFSFYLVSNLDEKTTSFIEIFDEEFYINLAGVGSFRAQFQPPNDTTDLDRLLSDIYVALAFILQKLSHVKEAEGLYDAYINSSSLKDSKPIFFSYIATKIQLNNIPDAIKYVVEIEKKSTNKDDGLALAQFGLSIVTSQTPKEQMNAVISAYEDLIESTDDPLVLATYYYNIGNCLRGNDYNREAIKHYLKAAKANSDYKLRPYWKKELAGLFFMIGKYRTSNNLYEQLIESENTPENNVLYADSLMLAGNYKRALVILEENATQLNVRNSEWFLKIICLEYLISRYGVEEQKKQGEAGREFIEKSSEKEILSFLKTKNALCPDSQFFIGTKLIEREEFEEACYCFLVSAFSDEHYKPSWLHAMGCAFNANLTGLLSLILEVASRKWGIEIVSEFFEQFSSGGDIKLNELALRLIQHCEEYISTFKDNQFEVRLRGSESSNSIVLDRATT
ncbi:TPA: DUF4365 domain-containing protein [Vibrio cholerae]|uniref:DUF4365 domain-containing protein n=1 Tax=Vibrio cholerae TaxID=666 RepID=UPI00155E38CD|nr:DUF4365 domain-containing protein [Vibrio cholerae]EGR3850428.1 DUF4365 domain-containing protein [Vibrio cholerae]MCR9708090.1 DUF4365 domain-containing protein [Vibrio cholerae]MDV2356423.1 DUF4365 domain-containing protein [Vibrio cholerae]NOE60305.1 DUF4365 domain-containing protein [Vibrio cholerae]HDV5273551.1 DUF4365 domain-containing protein [Vibrio cholerae]